MFFVLACLLLGDARAQEALPARPSAAEVKAWSPVDYNNFLVSVDAVILRQIVAQFRTAPVMLDEKMYLEHIGRLKALLHEGRRTCGLMPPFRGDTSMRDAMLESYDEVIVTLDEELTTMARLIFKEQVRDADLAAMEAAQRRLDEVSVTSVERINAAQAAFARKHGARVVRNEEVEELEQELEALEADFSAPGIPPEGSVLSADVHCDFALRYYNQMIDSHNAAVDAYSALMEASGEPGALSAGIPATREALSAALEVSSGWGAWQGDASLLKANDALIVGMMEALDGPVSELGTVYERKRLRPKDATRADILATQIDTTVNGLLGVTGEAYSGYMGRWHLEAYQQWLASQGRLLSE